MAHAALLLATEPLDKTTGRVTYSQEILKEFGWGPMEGGAKATSLGESFRAMLLTTLAAQCLLSGLAERYAGTGVDRAGSGFSKI